MDRILLNAVRQIEAQGKCAVRPQRNGLSLNGKFRIRFRGAVHDHFRVRLKPKTFRPSTLFSAAAAAP